MINKTGGYAFPKSHGTYYAHDLGMTMRQYFVGQLIKGACNGNGGLPDASYMKLIAERAYEMADIMLKVGEQ